MEGDGSVSRSLSKDSSGKSEHTLLTKSTIDSSSGGKDWRSLYLNFIELHIQLISSMFLIDRTISDDSKEQDSKYSTSFEEQNSAEHSYQLPHVPEKLPSTRLANIIAVSNKSFYYQYFL